VKSVDREAMIMLDDIEQAVHDLRRIYPASVSAANSVKVGSSSTGVPIRASGISDPTGEAAIDPRRQRRQSNIKKARKDIKAALTSSHSALSNIMRAADR
tara:strand:+ start:357 stop:656 length:300 start_codon:yes stop_codon:yes gene_type:complete